MLPFELWDATMQEPGFPSLLLVAAPADALYSASLYCIA